MLVPLKGLFVSIFLLTRIGTAMTSFDENKINVKTKTIEVNLELISDTM